MAVLPLGRPRIWPIPKLLAVSTLYVAVGVSRSTCGSAITPRLAAALAVYLAVVCQGIGMGRHVSAGVTPQKNVFVKECMFGTFSHHTERL